jgi:PKD repeat protein
MAFSSYKIKIIITKIATTCVLTLVGIIVPVYAQQQVGLKLFDSKDPFGTRVFIENKGQFKEKEIKDSIYFAFNSGQEECIYFTNKGLIHKLVKTFDLTEEEREKFEHSQKWPNGKAPQIVFVTMCWKNGNTNYVIEKFEKQNHYFTYGTEELNAYCYKKLLYKNVYKNIDIEYLIPLDKQHGIKYNVILHPGANVNDIKLEYGGAASAVRLSKDGNVTISNPVREITEYAPKSYYEDGEIVPSNFKVTDKSISFNLKSGKLLNKKLIIDPWVSSNSITFSGFDVDYDNLGNVYVYSQLVAKYNSSGVLQWTFSGSLVSPVWAQILNIYGNFVVNKSTGKIYVGPGVKSGGLTVIRLDANGNYDNFMTIPDPYPYISEVWDMGYDPVSGSIYAFGGGVLSLKNAFMINETTGAITTLVVDPLAAGAGNDIASACIDNNGEIYCIAARFTPAVNYISKINSSFTSAVWRVSSTYLTLSEGQNKLTFGITSSVANNGFNCLAVNSNYLFYYDGFNLAAYDKSTGLKIGSTTVPLTLTQQSGIAVSRNCNDIYLGGNNAILHYIFDGVAFISQPNITLNGSSGNYIYDVKLDNSNGILYFSGNGYIGTYNVPIVNGSVLQSACVPAVATPQGGCQNTVLNFNTSNCNSTLNYTWNFGDGSATTTGLTAAHSYANPGNYIIAVIAFNNYCGAQTLIAQTIKVDITSCPPPPPPCSDCISSFAPIPGKKYLLSAWAKEKNPAQSKTSYTFPSINVLYPSISGSAGPFAPSGAIIDGWQRIEGEFTIPANATDITLKLNCSTSDCYFDDVRVLPFDGSMKSYVYDPVNMRLVAELDERNYATLYEYDEEGKLIRVKKETEKGKMTIQENRSNTKK